MMRLPHALRRSISAARLLTARVLVSCGICVLAAGGPLSQWLRLAEVPAPANSDAAARYELVLTAAWERHTPPADRQAPQSDQKKKDDSKTPRLLRPLTDLWDTATAVHFTAGVPIVPPVCAVAALPCARLEGARSWYSSHAPPAHRPRGPPVQA